MNKINERNYLKKQDVFDHQAMLEDGWKEKKEFWTKKGEYGTWVWAKRKKKNALCAKQTICVECRHHALVNHENICYAKSKIKTDFVKGITEATGVQNCYYVNKRGKCPDFEKRTEENDYPKHILIGITFHPLKYHTTE
jgi:hypothetical protein